MCVRAGAGAGWEEPAALTCAGCLWLAALHAWGWWLRGRPPPICIAQVPLPPTQLPTNPRHPATPPPPCRQGWQRGVHRLRLLLPQPRHQDLCQVQVGGLVSAPAGETGWHRSVEGCVRSSAPPLPPPPPLPPRAPLPRPARTHPGPAPPHSARPCCSIDCSKDPKVCIDCSGGWYKIGNRCVSCKAAGLSNCSNCEKKGHHVVCTYCSTYDSRERREGWGGRGGVRRGGAMCPAACCSPAPCSPLLARPLPRRRWPLPRRLLPI